MKLFKKAFFVAAFLLTAGLTVQAQAPVNQDARMQTHLAQQLEEISSALELSEEQKEQVSNLQAAHFTKVLELRAAADGVDRQILREKMKDLRVKQTAQLKKVLTKEQYNKYVELYQN